MILGLGDSFYACGADDAYSPPGTPARLQTDWCVVVLPGR